LAEEKQEKTKKSSGLDMKIILIGLLIFLVAMGTTYFLMRSLMAPLYPKTEDSQKAKEVSGESLISAGEFTTNVGGSEGNHYLKVEVFLEVTDKKAQKTIEEYMPIIKDSILGVLSSKSMADLDVSNRENIKVEIKKKLNAKLGEKTIDNIYFTNFILQ
jgi:flagellar FliL protein